MRCLRMLRANEVFAHAYDLGLSDPMSALLIETALACVCCVAMAVACFYDIRQRIIPNPCCFSIALAGFALQCIACGVHEALSGCFFGMLISALNLGANRLMRRHGKSGMGFGDVKCMAALSLASGTSAAAACFAGLGAAAVFALAGLASGRMERETGIPLAPFLTVWLLVALGLSLIR